MKIKYLILGAGPAGLTFANLLKQSGENSFLVLEKESEAGGLCRSVEVDGSPFDIGGGHFLDVKNEEVNSFLFKFMPKDEWRTYIRDSKIVINKNVINSPIEANIWQMSLNDQVRYLKSIAIAGCNTGLPKPGKFVDWIYWKLGKKIADDYMIPYNQKMFSKELNQLGTYWLEKLPNVSFEETLLSCLEKKMYGSQPAHAQFYYPRKFGYGELWIRMAKSVKEHVHYNTNVVSVDFEQLKVNKHYQASFIILTIPWVDIPEFTGMPDSIQEKINKLKYNSIRTTYYPENLDTSAHWIYYPDLKLPYHRILVRRNFCPASNGYWTETNGERVTEDNSTFSYTNKYAYPLNTLDKPDIMHHVLEWARIKNVIGLGRWGEWQHYNSDITVNRSVECFKNLIIH